MTESYKYTNGSNQIWLSVAKCADLSRVSSQSIRSACKKRDGKFKGGRYVFRWVVDKNGGKQYEILLTSLPKHAQKEFGDKFISDIKSKPVASPSKTQLQNKQPSQSHDGFNQEEYERLWIKFKQLPEGNQQRAKERLDILGAYHDLCATGLPEADARAAIIRTHPISSTKLWRLINALKGHDRAHWLPLLATNHQGRQKKSEMTEEAWDFFLARWLTTSKPPMFTVYEETLEEGSKRGWIIPSYKTVARKVELIPETIKVSGRNGIDALRRMYPAQQRDYTTLRIHELWNSDGRRADVFCRWPDGSIGRPFVVVWQEVRTRMILGVRGFKNANMNVVKLALRNAIERCGALPESGLLDNGMEYAGKSVTGGQKTRNRFKVNEDDPLGVLTLLGVPVHWATPGSGQSKPVESFWRWLADNVDKRAEFVGAYCGNTPLARPEDCDPKKAVPIEVFSAELANAIDTYNQRPHSGNGMNRQSPLQLYQDLIASAQPRIPTKTQLLLCLMESQPYKPDKEDGSITINGVRYWHPEMSDLPRYKTFHVYYDPEDPTCLALVMDRNRVVCEAAPRGLTPFLDQDAAKTHGRNRNQFVSDGRNKLKEIKKPGLASLPQPLQSLEKHDREPTLTGIETTSERSDCGAAEIFIMKPKQKVKSHEDEVDRELVNRILTQDLLARKPIPSSR